MSYKLTVKNSKETFIREFYQNLDIAVDEYLKLCRYYRCITSQNENNTDTVIQRSSNPSTSVTVTLKTFKKIKNGHLLNS